MCEILKFYECENNGFSNTVVLRKIKLSHILVNTATDRALFSGEGVIVKPTLLWTIQRLDSPKHTFNLTNGSKGATNQRQPQGRKTECGQISQAGFSLNGGTCTKRPSYMKVIKRQFPC